MIRWLKNPSFIFPVVISSILFLVFNFWFFGPYYKYVLFIGLILLFVFLILIFIVFLDNRLKRYWPIFFQLILFTLTAYLFTFFISRVGEHLIFSAIIAFLFWIFLENLRQFFYQPRLYRYDFFKNSAPWLNFVIGFCGFSILSGLTLFYRVPPIFLLPFIFLLTFWLYYFFLYIERLSPENELNLTISKYDWQSILIFCLVISEAHIVLNFLPTTFHLNGLIEIMIFNLIYYLWKKYQKKYPSPTT